MYLQATGELPTERYVLLNELHIPGMSNIAHTSI